MRFGPATRRPTPPELTIGARDRRALPAILWALVAMLPRCSSEPQVCRGSSCADGSTSAPDNGVADTGGEPDAHPIDSGPADVGFLDGGSPPETGVRFSRSTCLPCNASCQAPALCLRSGMDSFCADDCASDRNGCPTGFACLNITRPPADPRYFCIPPDAKCKTGIGFGTACYEDDSSCIPLTHVCEGDSFSLGYCTESCGSDRDCPDAFHCAPGEHGSTVCTPRYIANPERCARDDRTAEQPCSVDTDCAMRGASCVRSDPIFPGVCVFACETGQSCPTGQSCRTTSRGAMCLPENCLCHGSTVPEGTADLMQQALEQAGLSRCGTIFSLFDWGTTPPDILYDPYRLSFYDAIHNEPLRAPGWAMSVVESLDRQAQLTRHPTFRAARLVEELAKLADRPAVAAGIPGMPDPIQPLATSVARLITASGGTSDPVVLGRAASAVPMDLQLAVAEVVDAIQRAHEARLRAIETRDPQAVRTLYDYGPSFVVARADGRGLAPANTAVRTLLNSGFGYGDMYGAATGVLDAIAHADLERFRVVPTATVATRPATLLFSADTPIGRIAIGDGQSGIYDPRQAGFEGAWALLLDLGGNDVYRVGAGGNASATNSVSVLIDLGGDDQYGYVEVPHPLDGRRLVSDGGGRYQPRMDLMHDYGPISLSDVPRQGGARVGTAILVDLGRGNDRYQSLRMSQGSGIFGAGVLVDDGGDDTYLAEAMAQGAGAFGIGVLFDLGGNDVRRSYTMSQGFAYARAVGLLYDVSGDDQYSMDVGDPAWGGDPIYFNAQRPGQANTTLGQGWGFGRRADGGTSPDRAFMSGGLGILIDAAGADRYEGSIFAQGGGYWFGTGILADESGDDHYDAMWYGMGAGAHYALGFLLDGGGDDVYGGRLPRINATLGGGHDYSAAFLIDESGNDIYNGSRITLGSGNSNGRGFFIDNQGDDQYSALSGFAIGSAGLVETGLFELGSPRRRVNTIGLFIDASGNDTYEREGRPPMGIGNNLRWVSAINMDPLVNLVEKGTGVDGTGESTLHARWP